MDTNSGLNYTDLFNETYLNTATINVGNLIAGSVQITGLTPSLWVVSDSNDNLTSRTLSGTANQITVNTVANTTTLSLPQDIAFTSTPIFVDMKLTGLTASEFVSSDASNSLISTLLQGTANQCTVSSNGVGTVTISLPQNINVGASPTFVDMKLTGLTASEFVSSDASNSLISTLLQGTLNQCTVSSNGAGTVTISLPQNINTSSSPTFVDLNLTGLTVSEFVSTDASHNLISTLLQGTANQCTVSSNGIGTVTISLPQNIDIGASPTFTGLTLSGLTTSLPLKLNGSHAVISQLISLTTDVSGVLPIANGGTGSSTALTNGKILVSSAGAIVEGTSSSNPSFTTLTTTATTNQILLGSTTLSNANGSSGTWTVPTTSTGGTTDTFLGSQTTQNVKNKSLFDDTCFFVNKLDITKQFGVSNTSQTTNTVAQLGCSAGATCVYTIPDSGSDTFCMLAYAQTLTNKTLTGNIAASFSNSGTITLPTATTTLVGTGTTDTLSNKTLDYSTCTFANSTKKIKFDPSGNTAAITSTVATQDSKAATYTFPATAGTGGEVCILNWNQTLQGKIFTSDCVFADSADTTKQIAFSPNGATASRTMILRSNHTANRIVDIPNATCQLVGLDTTDILTNKTFADSLPITDSTQSTSSTTGCLKLSGGVGIAKDMFIAGVVNATSTTDATSSTTGGVKITGGLGVAKTLWTGLSISVGGGCVMKGYATAITSDLGLYYGTASGWMRFVTNSGTFQFYSDGAGTGAGTTPIMTLNSSGDISAVRNITASGDLQCKRYCIASSQLTQQSIPNSADTAVAFDTDIASLTVNWSTSRTTTSRFIGPIAGYYIASYVIFWQNTGAAEHDAWITKNGDGTYRQGFSQIQISAGQVNCQTGTGTFKLNGSTDYIECYCYQNTGIAQIIGVTGASSYRTCQFTMHYLHE